MASLLYLQGRGAISNKKLVGMLSILMEKLKRTSGARVFKPDLELEVLK